MGWWNFTGLVQGIKSFIPQIKPDKESDKSVSVYLSLHFSTSALDPLQSKPGGHLAEASLKGVCDSEIFSQFRCARTLCDISLGEAWCVSSLAKQACIALPGYFCCCLYGPEISLLFDIFRILVSFFEAAFTRDLFYCTNQLSYSQHLCITHR